MRKKNPKQARQILNCESLEERDLPSGQAVLSAGVLTVTGNGSDRIRIVLDGANLDVYDGTTEVGTFANSAVTSITVTTAGGYNTVIVGPTVTQSTTITGGAGGTNKFVSGGGATNLEGGSGKNYLYGNEGGSNVFQGGGQLNEMLGVASTDTVVADPNNVVLQDVGPTTSFNPGNDPTLTTSDVQTLLERAAAASSNTGAIIAVVDRNGNILGVDVEGGVSSAITGNQSNLIFSIDGAVSLARTAAFFSSDQDELTSRTVQYISQSTITEREVDSNPNITDQNSPLYGPGYVAPVNIGGNFPPGVENTPLVDLFEIEQTNRDGNQINGTALPNRFNVPDQYTFPGALTAPISYGVAAGLNADAQNRGIATLPGGEPIFMVNNKTGSLQEMGGIGVFFPGTTGYATAENSKLSSTFNPNLPDLSALAEWMAFAAVGGVTASLNGLPTAPVGTLSGIAPLSGVGLVNAVVNLGGIQLPLFGGIGTEGLDSVVNVGNGAGRSNPLVGQNFMPIEATLGNPATLTNFLPGKDIPTGWLVFPHSGDGITQAQVEQIVAQGIAQANQTRSAIRVPNPVTNNNTIGTNIPGVFVIAVSDNDGNVVGLYAEPDATVFSIDVAVAKARNANYYANPNELQPQDQLAGIPAGTAFSARTFRYLAQPLYPEGINGSPPGPWSILNDPGTNPGNGLMVGPALPASNYMSVEGYASFHPNANFRDPNNPLNQNGVVFFPGSAPLYADKNNFTSGTLAGGLGVSGDGVNQDDVVTQAAELDYTTPTDIYQADQVIYRGVRLPYQLDSRNPTQF